MNGTTMVEWLLGGGLVGLAAIIFTMMRMVAQQGQWVGTVTEQYRALAAEMHAIKNEVHDFSIEMRRWIETHLQVTRDIDRRLSQVEARQENVLRHLTGRGGWERTDDENREK